MRKQIVILGPNSISGQTAVKYFSSQGYKVTAYDKEFTPDSYITFCRSLSDYPNAIIFNTISQSKDKESTIHDLLWANSTLPLALAHYLSPGQFLIHLSSDCVFSGDKGNYTTDDKPDAVDEYGWTRRLGEQALFSRPGTLIIRGSFIGIEENPNPKGLLGWFLSQFEGTKLNGYSNHLWNGITTLELCKLVEEQVILSNKTRTGLIHAGTAESYSKYDLLMLFKEVFERNIEITPIETDKKLNRTLISEIKSKKFPIQLKEMQDFWYN